MDELTRRCRAASDGERAELAAELRALGELFSERPAEHPEEALAASLAWSFLAEEASRTGGDTESALELARRALEMARQAPPVHRSYQLVRVASQAARLEWQIGRSSAAVDLLRESLRDTSGNPEGRAFALATLADYERILADWSACEQHALEASELLAWLVEELPAEIEAPYVSLQRAVAGLLVRLNLELGLFEVASEWRARHAELAARVDDEHSRLDDVLLRGTELLYAGRAQLAERELGLELGGDALREPYSRARVELLQCEALVEQVDARSSDRAKQARERLSRLSTRDDLERGDRLEVCLMLARLELAAGAFDAARAPIEEAFELASSDGYLPGNRSLPFVVALRARLLRSSVGEVPDDASTLAELEAAFEALLEQWRKVPQRPGGVGLLRFANKCEVLAELLTWTLGDEPDEDAIDRCLRRISRAQAHGALSARLGLSEVGLAELRAEVLGPRDALLVLLPGADRTHAFLVGREHASHRYLTTEPSLLVSDAHELSLAISDPASGVGWRALAARLGGGLFPPELRERLEAFDGLAVIGADLLGQPACEVLPLSDGAALGTRWALSSLPSLPAAVALARRAAADMPKPRTGFWLLAATGPPPAKGLASIELAEGARAAVLAPFAVERRSVHTGARATRARLAEAGFASAAVGCILAHGTRDAGSERPTGLRLSADPEQEGDLGELWCDDVDGPGAAGCPRLMVLASCGSSYGAHRPGDDGLGHLGGAFLARGALAVVLARHDVELAATLRLLEVLNARLAAGDTGQEALRRARAVLRDDPRTAHPFHWGAFQLSGLGQRAPLPAGR